MFFFNFFQHFICPSCSNESSNSFKSFSKSKYVRINSTKLEGGLQPTLKSLGKCVLTKKIKIELFNCKWHLLWFVSMLAKEKNLLVSICDPIMFKI